MNPKLQLQSSKQEQIAERNRTKWVRKNMHKSITRLMSKYVKSKKKLVQKNYEIKRKGRELKGQKQKSVKR